MNVWMWRHGHNLEANLKMSDLRFVFNVWTSSWTHDVILHRNWWCHAFTSKPVYTWESKPPYYWAGMIKPPLHFIMFCSLEPHIMAQHWLIVTQSKEQVLVPCNVPFGPVYILPRTKLQMVGHNCVWKGLCYHWLKRLPTTTVATVGLYQFVMSPPSLSYYHTWKHYSGV